MCHNADMSDSDRTHEFSLALDTPAGSLTFDLPARPPYLSRVIATLRLSAGHTLVIGDGEEYGSVFVDALGGAGESRIALRLTDAEVHRLILALRSAQSVER